MVSTRPLTTSMRLQQCTGWALAFDSVAGLLRVAFLRLQAATWASMLPDME